MSSNKLLGRSFLLLWLSETVFNIGAALLNFALGAWVFEQSGSVQQFSWVILSSSIPALLSVPFAGAMADHFDRRWVIAGCDGAAALMILAASVLLFKGMLVVEHLYVMGAVGGVIGALRSPSYQAAVAQIVPQDQFVQANGLVTGTQGILQIGAPLAAGYLMASWGLEGVMLAELLLLFAGGFSAFAALSSAVHAIRGTVKDASTYLFQGIQNSFGGVRNYFQQYPLMRGLVLYILIQEALLMLAASMLTPLVLSNHGSDTLGVVLTVGAVGGVFGALTLVASNIKRHLMLWVLLADVGLGGFVIGIGMANSLVPWAVCAFGAFACAGVSKGCSNALWMRKVPKDRQGSVFATLAAANLLLKCLVILVVAAFVEQWLAPMMMPRGSLANTVGLWLGVGKGRGVALLFVLAGGFLCLVSLIALFQPRLTRLDDLVLDPSRADVITPSGDLPIPAVTGK